MQPKFQHAKAFPFVLIK
uniref:Uncharacterized protein n=1 Tax=Anguilla anguilla TaxID=7936 RepID=A0A0E9VLL3_ANGAN